MKIDPNEVVISDRINPDEVEIVQTQKPKSGYGLTENPGIAEQFLGGAKHAWDRAAAGLQSAAGALGLPTGESLQPLVQQGSQFVKETGPASTVGQVAGDVAMSAPVALKVFKGLNAARGLKTAIAGEAALNAGYGALTSDPGKRGEGAAWGAGGTLAGHSVLPLARGLGNATANVLGMTTGAGGQSVKQAFKGGDDFVANMRGKVEPAEVVEQARAGIHTMRQNMQEAYKQNKQVWAAGQQPLDLAPVVDTYNKVLASFGHNGFSKVGPSEARVLEEMNDVLTDFASNPKWHTTEGFDALKQRLQAIYPESPQMRQAQRAVSTLADSVKQTIVAQNPTYANAMQDYWQRSAQLSEIEKSLSLGNKATTDTALRKLQSLMRNNVNTNYGQRLNSAEALAQQGGQDVLPAVAGQALNSWMPRGIQQAIAGGAGTMGLVSGVINPLQAAGAALVQSPRIVGEVANFGGNVWDKLRAEAAIKALRHGVGPAVAGKRD